MTKFVVVEGHRTQRPLPHATLEFGGYGVVWGFCLKVINGSGCGKGFLFEDS